MVIDEAISAADVERAEDLIGRVYRRARFLESATPFAFRQRVQGDEDVNLARFEISSTAHISVDLEGMLGIGQVRAGTYRAASNGVDVDPGRPFLLAPGQAQSWSSDLDLTVVNIRLRSLAKLVDIDLADSAVRVRGSAPTSEPNAVRWQRTVAYAESVFSDSDLLHNQLIRATTSDLVMAAALAALPIEIRTRYGAAQDAALPSALRRAIAHIEQNLSAPLNVEAIAGAARMSARGVQSLFRRELGVSPLGYLRTARLSAAHDELVAADAGVTTVREVAQRWGFAHQSRFADEYRAVYGELPSTTLRH